MDVETPTPWNKESVPKVDWVLEDSTSLAHSQAVHNLRVSSRFHSHLSLACAGTLP